MDVEVRVGDTVLVKQTKTTTKPPFDPNPYTVVEFNGTQAVLERIGKRKKRNFNKIKVIKDKVKEKILKERRKRLEEAARGETEREDSRDSKRSVSSSVSKRPQTDDDDNYDFDLSY